MCVWRKFTARYFVFSSISSSENYDVLYLDFSKAFYKVPHHRLLLKLQAHGVDWKVLQRVEINGSRSEWGNVTCRVPQGSVLGPLFFIIYINDSDTGITSDVSKFANDTKIGRVIQSDHDVSVLLDELDTLL